MGHIVTTDDVKTIAQKAVSVVTENPDLAEVFHDNSIPEIIRCVEEHTEKVVKAAEDHFIPIPQIRITDAGVDEYVFMDFDLDLSVFDHKPIDNQMLIQNLRDQSQQERIDAEAIDFEGVNPLKAIITEIRKQPEIDYNRCGELLIMLVSRILEHYEYAYGKNGMQNIVMMNKVDIANKLYKQMMQHFYFDAGLIQEEVLNERTYNLRPNMTYKTTANLYDGFTGDIHSVLFTGIKRGVFSEAKFDSAEGELTFARIIERDPDVQNWLRPAPQEFNIKYNGGKRYEPDFVVETADTVYLVEVKAERDLNDPDVIAKKKRGIMYCETVTHWADANGRKPWKYLFIPANQIYASSTFEMLAKKFTVTCC